MDNTNNLKANAATALAPKFHNRENAESQVCEAFTALGRLAGVDVDSGKGPDDLDAALIEAAYQSNYNDPHFLGGPFCFNYAITKDKVDVLEAKATAVTQRFGAHIRERGDEETLRQAEYHIGVIDAAIVWLRKTNRSL